VTLTLGIFIAIIACLLALLGWALSTPRKRGPLNRGPAADLEQAGRRHATYLPLIRRALCPADIVFLEARGPRRLAGRVKKERRRVALSYLAGLHSDFLQLVRIAKVVAALSPEVATAQELERVWLSVQFSWRYRMLRAEVYAGTVSLRGLDGLSHMVSELAIRVENAMSEIGERAAIAAKLASSLDRGGVDVA
jgi:hypothetical protein